MKCLNDAQIQAVADNEAPEDVRRHAARCASCRERVRERQALTAAILDTISIPAEIPPAAQARIGRALATGGSSGATRLRPDGAARPPWRSALWSAGAVAAA